MEVLHNSVFAQYSKRSTSSADTVHIEYKRSRLDTKFQSSPARKSERAKPKKTSSSECSESIETADTAPCTEISKLIVFCFVRCMRFARKRCMTFVRKLSNRNHLFFINKCCIVFFSLASPVLVVDNGAYSIKVGTTVEENPRFVCNAKCYC